MKETLMPKYYTACPLDCAATCALSVDLNQDGTIRNISGDKDHPFTAGVICKKVKNYKDLADSPLRLTKPLKRIGKKGSGKDGANQFEEISLNEALDILTNKFRNIRDKYGPESLWILEYAGTMGWVQRRGIHRLCKAFGISDMKASYCVAMTSAAYLAGVGAAKGSDNLECYDAKQILIWGRNPYVTQLPLMSHFLAARKNNNAKIIVIDVYESQTAKLADEFYCIKPGSDGALALGMMRIILENNWQDDEYLKQYTDFDSSILNALQKYTLEHTAAETGLSQDQILKLTHDYAHTPQTLMDLGFGFTRRRSGAMNMHAVTCLPALTGHWKYKGGGMLWSNAGLYGEHFNDAILKGGDFNNPQIPRALDQSLIGKVLARDKAALLGGKPIYGLITQSINPLAVGAKTDLAIQGFLREDLFTCVHDQFLTETARYADLVIPATNFLEHDDMYSVGGWHHMHAVKKIRNGPAHAIENHELINHLGRALGSNEPSFQRSAKEQLDLMLKESGKPNFETLHQQKGYTIKQSFEETHFLNGFPNNDGLFHFKADWAAQGASADDLVNLQPSTVKDLADFHPEYPFRLIIPPKEDRLNSTFALVKTGEGKGQSMPKAYIHPSALAQKGITANKGQIEIFNDQAKTIVDFEVMEKMNPLTIVIEGVFDKKAFSGCSTPNALIYDDEALPAGGLCVHDIAVDYKLCKD